MLFCNQLQIAEIKQMTNKVKTEIHQLMANRINQIEQILAGNHDKMERLTNARFDVRQLLADYHVTELVQHTDKKVMELTEVNDIKPETFDWRKSVLTCEGKDLKPFVLLRTNMLSKQSPRYRFMMKPQHDNANSTGYSQWAYQVHIITTVHRCRLSGPRFT